MKNHVTPRHTARPSRSDWHKSHAERACNFRDVYYSKNLRYRKISKKCVFNLLRNVIQSQSQKQQKNESKKRFRFGRLRGTCFDYRIYTLLNYLLVYQTQSIILNRLQLGRRSELSNILNELISEKTECALGVIAARRGSYALL